MIFDLDGTLVDVAAAVVRCLGELIRTAKASVAPQEIRAVVQRHPNARHALASWTHRQISIRGGVAPPVEAIVRALAHVDTVVQPDDRVVAAVSAVAASHRVALVTNGRSKLQRAKLRAAGIADLFRADLILVSGELGLRKPDPRIFQLALDRLGEPAAAAMFVGNDEREDIEGALALGMFTCRVGQAGVPSKADVRIQHVSALMGVLSCAT